MTTGNPVLDKTCEKFSDIFQYENRSLYRVT